VDEIHRSNKDKEEIGKAYILEAFPKSGEKKAFFLACGLRSKDRLSYDSENQKEKLGRYEI